ncbi:hypothetical protein BKA67DRAFT_536124 [Truncatella angustata]|uniref:Uncharacterized protein n=1 Tax=Truncatella angustata TaxID=152316 RepID=A0A9P8ZZA0_9PEZI|nr:uncharacterized protein BKA67DRAFT_536124 [Truncatella angustata]KAH6654831.1 hypothetical protein BKA67DRAFT_536124 [Truncatella angustata]
MASELSAQTVGPALLRISPIILSSANLTLIRVSDFCIRSFNASDVPPESIWVVMPGSWLHIRDRNLPLIFATYVPNIIPGILNARGSTLFGILDGGSKTGMVGCYYGLPIG